MQKRAADDSNLTHYFEELKRKHHMIDNEIARMLSEKYVDQEQVSKLKKAKLALKEKIVALGKDLEDK